MGKNLAAQLVICELLQQFCSKKGYETQILCNRAKVEMPILIEIRKTFSSLVKALIDACKMHLH